jgi:hypothetical protein
LRPAFHRLLILCCAIYLSGAHWMLLQMTAWTGMLIARSQKSPVVEAVESTFDGDHPCRMCEAIKEAREEEEKREQDVPLVAKAQEHKFVLFRGCELPPAVCIGELAWQDPALIFERRASAPSIPPPRG